MSPQILCLQHPGIVASWTDFKPPFQNKVHSSLGYVFFLQPFTFYIYIYDLVPKGVHENRTKGVENKVDDTLKLVVFLKCAQC